MNLLTTTPVAASAAAPDALAVVGLIVQVVAVVVAAAAAVIALGISIRDRKTMLAIAERERGQTQLLTELEYAVRLAANRAMGGSSDPVESNRLGAEALALALVVGEHWAPDQYARAMDYQSRDELIAGLKTAKYTPSNAWRKDMIEAGLAVLAIKDRLYGTN